MAATSTGTGAQANAPAAPGRRQRRAWIWIIGAIAVVIGGVIAVVQYAPGFLARYLVRNYFQGLNIDVEGVETLNIDILRQEITFGPVGFGGPGTEEAAQVGNLGLKFDFGRLFQKRAMLNSILVEGIRLDVRQTADGEILLNGIALRQILAEEAEKRQEARPRPTAGAEPTDAAGSEWSAGLDSLRLRDSRVVFTDQAGGQATMTLKSLELDGFLSWAPDQPGRFRMDADLNGITITASGQAKPFAENIEVEAQLDVVGVELAKVELYTGSLGFERGAGTIDIRTNTKAAIFPDGRIEARQFGEVEMTSVDLSNPQFGNVGLESGRIRLDGAVLQIDGSGNIGVSGRFDVALTGSNIALTDGTKVRFAALEFVMSDGSVTLPKNGPPAILGWPDLRVSSLVMDGPDIAGSVESALFRPTTFAVHPSGREVTIDATGPLDATGVRLLVPDPTEPISIETGQFHADLDALKVVSAGRHTIISGVISLTADKFVLAMLAVQTEGRTQQTARLESDRFTGRFSRVDVDDDKPGTKVRISGSSDFTPLIATGPATGGVDASSVSAATAHLDLPDLDIHDYKNGTDVAGQIGLQAKALNGHAVMASPKSAAIEANDFTLDLARIAVKAPSGGTKLVTGAGRTTATGFSGRVGSGKSADVAVNLANWELDFADLDVAAGEGVALKTRARTRFRNLNADVNAIGTAASDDPVRSHIGDMSIDLKRMIYQTEGATHLSLAGAIHCDSADIRAPAIAGRPAANFEARGLRFDADDLTWGAGVKPGGWQARFDLRLGKLSGELDRGDLAAFRVGDLQLDDFSGNSRPEYAFDRLTIGSLQAALTRKPAATLTEGGPQISAATTKPKTTPARDARSLATTTDRLPRIRIGGFGLPNGAKLVFRDETVSPPLIATVHVDSLAVFNVDSTNVRQSTDVQMRARIVEATSEGRIGLQGSAALFKDKPDFDLTAQIENFGLSMLSPYIGPMAGVDVASGTLGADVAGRATAGQLDSEVTVVVRELRFTDRSDATPDQVAAEIGVPLSTMIELLEDPDGTIDLTVPIAGDINSPEFDYSKVIWSAIVRVLRAAIVAPFKLVSASISLIGAASKGSGDGSGGMATEQVPALAPVSFQPGEKMLTFDARSAVASFQQLLEQRPKMSLKLCGMAVAKDLEARAGQIDEAQREKEVSRLTPQLRLLAQERMLEVGRGLTAKSKVDAAQVRLCEAPRVDLSDAGEPRVEVSF